MLIHLLHTKFSNRNSYRYKIREPREPNADDTKYKYDYTLQQPLDEKVIKPKKIMHTKVDQIVQENPGKLIEKKKMITSLFGFQQY